MKKTAILCLVAGMCLGQASNRQIIQSSGLYYCGTGTGLSSEEAIDRARADLCAEIAVHVASTFESKVEETSVDIKQSVTQVINTYAAATLRDVIKEVRPISGNKYEAFCYLKKAKVDTIFEERRRLIADYVANAAVDEAEGNLAQALKHDYFALILVNSLPDVAVVYKGVNYTIEIPKRIIAMLESVQFVYDRDRMISDREREITLRMVYHDKPISALDFTFWDGTCDVDVSGRDGFAVFTLLGGSVQQKDLKLNVKYANYRARNEYNIIADLWNVVKKPDFPSSRKEIALHAPGKDALSDDSIKKKSQGGGISGAGRDIDSELKSEEGLASDISVSAAVEKFIREESLRFVNTIASGDTVNVRQTWADDPFMADKMVRYISRNKPRILKLDSASRISRLRDGWELRRIHVLHSYPDIHRQSNEYLVLDFDASGRLVDFNTCVNGNLFEKYAGSAAPADDRQNRRDIVRFLEKYRTAYLTRDLPTVNLMFAEDALIIVGRKIEKTSMKEDAYAYQPFKGQPEYGFVKMSKAQYMDRLRDVFRSQQDIALEFESFNLVRKNDTPNIYGVEMRQSWASTRYADEGYLFLLIDFNGPDPLIYVRAWQPNAWSDNELIRTANFKVYK